MVSIRSPALEGKKIHNPKQCLMPKYTTSDVAGLGHRQNCGSFPVDLRQREKRWRDLLVPELRHLNRDFAPSKIWASINDDGCVIVDDFISPDLLEALCRELMPSVARHRRGTRRRGASLLGQLSRGGNEAHYGTLREELGLGDTPL